MGTVTNLLLCSFVVVIAQGEVHLEADKPFLRVQLYDPAVLECCYNTTEDNLQITWIKHVSNNGTWSQEDVNRSHHREKTKNCYALTIKSVQMNESGFYFCALNNSNIVVFTHGTYLQVYKPLEKTINLSENTKNKILTAEGILLLLCVLLPAVILLCQSKRLNELERKKVKKEEENIYQGLNLDDCCATYDQIERSLARGPYQDVCNIMEEEEEIQLEKP